MRKVRIWDNFNACFWYSENYKSMVEFYKAMAELEQADNDLEKEQLFTGIVDFDGKDIYAGDIIKCGDTVGEVQYSEMQAAFIILWYPHNEKKKSGSDNLGSTHPSPIKYIFGNTKENPELIN